MAQSWRVNVRSPRKPRPPLDQPKLEALAVHYAARYATTRAKLSAYLTRKLAERGWAGEGRPDPVALSERMSELGYVDDRAFASTRAASLARRGYGLRRLDMALKAAGIGAEDGEDARRLAADSAWDSALAFARRRAIGPFAHETIGREGRQKAVSAMLRAGHSYEIARKIVNCPPGEMPETEDG